MISREQVYLALFGKVIPLRAAGAVDGSPDGELANGVQASPGTATADRPFQLVSREVIEVQRVPPGLQPVLFMDEAMEDYFFDGNGLLHKRWTVYFHVGCTTIKGTAASAALNPLIDLLEQAVDPETDNHPLGLGPDIIESAQLSGLAVKNLGNNFTDPNERQAVAYVPFQIVFAPLH
jgi:hypothetical protein